MKAMYTVEVLNGKVRLYVREKRKRPSKGMVMNVDVVLGAEEALGLGKALQVNAEKADIENTLAGKKVPQFAHDAARYAISKGKRILAVKLIREHTDFSIFEGVAYVNKYWPKN